MKYNKLLLIGIIALVAIVSVGAVSAGWFDFLGGDSSTASDANLTGKEVKLAAAASLKNTFDEKLIPMFEKKYPGVKVTHTYDSSGELQTQIESVLDEYV